MLSFVLAGRRIVFTYAVVTQDEGKALCGLHRFVDGRRSNMILLGEKLNKNVCSCVWMQEVIKECEGYWGIAAVPCVQTCLRKCKLKIIL